MENINNIRRNNEDMIKNLERERKNNENTIADLRKTADGLRLDHTKLEIGIMKINSQLQFLEQASKGGGNDIVRQKIDKFGRHINQTEQETEKLKDDLNNMNKNWIDTIDRANRDMSDHIKDNQNKATGEKINELLAELQSKQSEIDEYKRKRSQLEHDLASTDPDGTQREIDALSSELSETNKEMYSLLKEKNRLYGELVQYTKELFELNTVLQKNEQEIARLRLLENIVLKEQNEKKQMLEDMKACIEDRSQMLADLQDEIARNELTLQQLEETLQQRRDEGVELDQLLADRDAEIRELEARLEEINRNKVVETSEEESVKKVVHAVESVGPSEYVADANDEVDVLLAQYI